jgi:transcription elongation factor Elf1
MSYQQPNRAKYKCVYCGKEFEEFCYLQEDFPKEIYWCGQCESREQEAGLPPLSNEPGVII